MDNAEPVKTQLRLPGTLQEKLVEASKVSGRSMNAEIVHRLQASFLAVEHELLERRTEETRRLTYESISAHDAANVLLKQHNEVVEKLGNVENSATDVRTRVLYQRYMEARARADFLDGLWESADDDLQALRAKLIPREHVEDKPPSGRKKKPV